MSIFGLLFGEVSLRGAREDAASLLNLSMELSLPYRAARQEEDGFRLRFSPRDAKVFLGEAGARGLAVEVVGRHGLPYLFYRYRRRVGLYVGCLAVAALLFCARGVVWSVRITGNEQMNQAALQEILAGYGIAPGRTFSSIDADVLETKILLENPDIAWISIHFSGTTVNVELRETRRGSPVSGAVGNLVASADGLIERVEIYDGQSMVKVGDVVRRGDILAGGVYDSGRGGLRMTRASGEVFARTVRDIEICVPFVYEKKEYTGRTRQEKFVKFFGNEIKVFTNTGNEGGTCDIIYYEKMLSLAGGREIPVGVRTVKYLEYTAVEARYTEEEAMNEAFRRLADALAALAEDTELLQKNIAFEITDEAYVLSCRIVCIENIAREQKIEIGS